MRVQDLPLNPRGQKAIFLPNKSFLSKNSATHPLFKSYPYTCLNLCLLLDAWDLHPCVCLHCLSAQSCACRFYHHEMQRYISCHSPEFRSSRYLDKNRVGNNYNLSKNAVFHKWKGKKYPSSWYEEDIRKASKEWLSCMPGCVSYLLLRILPIKI